MILRRGQCVTEERTQHSSTFDLLFGHLMTFVLMAVLINREQPQG